MKRRASTSRAGCIRRSPQWKEPAAARDRSDAGLGGWVPEEVQRPHVIPRWTPDAPTSGQSMTQRDGSSEIVPSRPVISPTCSTEVSDAHHASYERQECLQHVEGRSEGAGGIGRPREGSKTSALASRTGIRTGVRTRAGACVLSATDLAPCPNRQCPPYMRAPFSTSALLRSREGTRQGTQVCRSYA
jgi:hypothetical protein